MPVQPNCATILLADDDDDDRLLVQRSLAKMAVRPNLRTVCDGVDLMDYLHRRGAYSGAGAAPQPDLVLLDLNMPRKDGRQALAEIKSDARLRRIPVVILSTSSADEDVATSYDLHANSYIQKPASAQRMTEVMSQLQHYWFGVVEAARRDC